MEPLAPADRAIVNTPRRPLYTIGYGNQTWATFLEWLRFYDIDVLIDVRSHPYASYQQDFSQKPLAHLCKAAGIRYAFLGEYLGGKPDNPDLYTNGVVDYEKCRVETGFQTHLARLENAFHQQISVALMCGCARPENCHRSKLIGTALSERGVPVHHILPDGSLLTQEKLWTSADTMPDLFGFQPHLAGRWKRSEAAPDATESSYDP